MPAFLTIAFTVFDKPLSNTNLISLWTQEWYDDNG
jgi:hypothetical protein